MNKDSYTLGKCHKCQHYKALKNGRCIDCKDNDTDFLNTFEDLFGFERKKKKS